MKRASIDLGTNTCLLLVVEWDSEGKKIQEVLTDRTNIVRLGKGVDQNRKLAPEAMDRTIACLNEYAAVVKELGLSASEVRCVATSQARDAENGRDFFQKIQREIGFSFEVLSGEQEAAMSFQGSLLDGMNSESSAVIDIGGGSTEIISISSGQSLDIGAVRFTERFLKSDPVTDDEFWAAQRAIDEALMPLKDWRVQQIPELQLVAVAGTAVSLARWFLGESITAPFRPDRIAEVTLTRGDLHRMVEELKWRSVEERKALPGIEPDRADVLLAGSMILWRACELLSFPELQVSPRGLRYGVIQ